MADPVVLSDEADILPFWQRLPLFFRYPLHFEPLAYMLVLALATLLAFIVPLPSPFDLLVVLFGVWLAFIRYAYKTLDQTAQGLLTPDQHQLHEDKERANLPYKQFAIFMVVAFVLGFAAQAGGLVFGAVLIFSVLSLPASIMILAITRSFRAGLNPLVAVGMMRTIGMPYLGLCAFLFLLSASEQALQMILMPRLPGWMLLPAMNFVTMYFTLIMFNLMGYVVYQFHHLLGVQVSSTAQANGKPVGESHDLIGQLIAEGQITEALDLAYEAQRTAPDEIATNSRYHKLLALAGQNDRLFSHSKRYLTLLLQKNRGDDALDLFRSMQQRDAAYAPEQPAQLLRLAEAARHRREYPQALDLIRGFDKRFPNHADIPSVYLLGARILCENLHNDASARQILRALLKRYPDHPAGVEARQLLTVIDRLAETAKAG